MTELLPRQKPLNLNQLIRPKSPQRLLPPRLSRASNSEWRGTGARLATRGSTATDTRPLSDFPGTGTWAEAVLGRCSLLVPWPGTTLGSKTRLTARQCAGNSDGLRLLKCAPCTAGPKHPTPEHRGTFMGACTMPRGCSSQGCLPQERTGNDLNGRRLNGKTGNSDTAPSLKRMQNI